MGGVPSRHRDKIELTFLQSPLLERGYVGGPGWGAVRSRGVSAWAHEQRAAVLHEGNTTTCYTHVLVKRGEKITSLK